ncbi:hypothetical protein RN001_015918 [Aquatica leii]|uniref:C2H2-type domain-containing protein n=1 Tax=Aquatica leii TaxID=1421715 RepID=A0AAN7NXE1_9COLE|nr:hypothetical protein RN001_015918 [Aquatica leii]
MLFKGNSSRLELLIEKIHINKENSEVEENIAGSIGTEHGSWGSNTPEQASPAPSSCPTPSSSLSDIADAEIAFTVGITETTPYACKICNKAFARSSLLSKHEQSHTDQLQYGCSYCPRLFKHKRSRDRHIKLHTGDKKYKCVHCQTAFSRSDHLKIHMKTHDNSKPFRCLICNRGYNTAAALTSHQQSHAKQNSEGQQSPGSFKCHHCTESFSRYDLLQIHVSSVHATLGLANQQTTPSNCLQEGANKALMELPKWVCMYCGHDFLTLDEMQQHVNLEHSAIINGNFANNNLINSETSSPLNDKSSPVHETNSSPTYACDSCTMQFDSIEKLRVHENCIHWKPPQALNSNSSVFLKDYNSCLQSAQSINAEIQNSPNSQPIQSHPTDLSRKRRGSDMEISVLPKRETNDVSIQNLAGSSHDTLKKEEWSSYICSICGTQLPNFASFMVHMDIHMSVNATPANVILGGYCPLCGEAYRDQTELNNHIVLHTLSYKPGWCCRVCKKVFNEDLEDLQRHLIENHTCTTYRCCVCEQLFETKTAMLMHLTKKHSSECQHYRCKFCPEQIFHNQISAEMHISQHVPRLFNTSRKSSYGAFSYRSDYNRIERMVKNLQCPYCRQCFKGEYLHQMHMLKEHKDYREAHSSRMTEDCTLEQLSNTRAQQENSSNMLYSNNTSTSDNISRYDRNMTDSFICDICGSTDFSNDTELAAHKKLHHVKTKVGPVSLQCAYCNEHCKSRSDLENHMKNHQINSSKGKHKCNICDEIYTSAITLAEHKLSHCKIVSGNTCTQCKTVLSDDQSFYSHQLQHSAVLSKQNSQISLPANCIICCQTLQTDVEIKLHANFHLQHLIQKEFLCSMCSRIFDTRTGITVQGYEKSSENLQIAICKECMSKCGNNNSSNSPRPKSLKSENADINLYSCIKCPQTFENESDVKKHATTHIVSEGANHECHICRSIFSSSLKLQLHVIEHSFFGTGQFRCYICSSVFTTANGLLSHMLEHGVNSKPYECVTCQMKFFFQTELDNHKYEHVLARSIAQPIIVNNKCESEESSEKIKRELIVKCPYCDVSTSQTYMDVHIRCCSQNPDIKKKQDDKRKHKFLENNNIASCGEDKKT